ncbi:hypothetical protein AAMO2058_000448600 [Amorphochlora amoebiformis]
MKEKDQIVEFLNETRNEFLTQNEDSVMVLDAIRTLKETRVLAQQKELDIKQILESLQQSVDSLVQQDAVDCEKKEKELQETESTIKSELEDMRTEIKSLSLRVKNEKSNLTTLSKKKNKLEEETNIQKKKRNTTKKMDKAKFHIYKISTQTTWREDSDEAFICGTVHLMQKNQVRSFKLPAGNKFETSNYLWDTMWEDHS